MPTGVVPVPGRCTHHPGLLKQPDDHGPCPCPFPTMADPSPGPPPVRSFFSPFPTRRYSKAGRATIGGSAKIPNPHTPLETHRNFSQRGENSRWISRPYSPALISQICSQERPSIERCRALVGRPWSPPVFPRAPSQPLVLRALPPCPCPC